MSNRDYRDSRYDYHYDREERLAMKNSPSWDEEARKGGFFKRNRSLGIILVDILIIVIVIILVRLFVQPADYKDSTENFTVTLKAFAMRDDVISIVEIKRTGNGNQEQKSVNVNFILGEQRKAITAGLPGKTDETEEISVTMNNNTKEESITTEINIDRRTIVLNKKIE